MYNKLNRKFIQAFEKADFKYQKDHIDRISWIDISFNQRLSENFIEKYGNKVHWANISHYQKLSEEFIEKHQDKVDWFWVSSCQELSWKFISKFYNALNINAIMINDRISEGIKDKLKKLQIFK